MRNRTMGRWTTIAMTLVLLATLTTATGIAAQEPSHGGSIANTHNDLYIVQEDADNTLGIEAAYGQIFVKETISFAQTDPLKVPDYGIVYVDPTFVADPNTPIVVAYTHDYTIANYTLQLINLTDEYVGNFTGYTTTSASLRAGIDLGPEGSEMPHPKVNTTYLWQVWAVTAENRQLLAEFGGEVTTEIFNDTVFDWSTLELPVIGAHSYEADSSDLAALTISSVMEPHPSLSAGWYKFTITDEVFEYGVNLTIELRYTGTMSSKRVVLDKLIFNERPMHLDVYHKSDMEVFMYDANDGKGNKIPPTKASTGAGVPTKFSYPVTFSLVVQEEGTDSTDWGQYGRYAILAVLIGVLLVLVLWSGRGKRSSEDGGDVRASPETDHRRTQLEEEKASIMAQMKELDQRHDDGELGTGVWNRKRKTLKGRVVTVMRQLEELDGVPPKVVTDDGPKLTGDRASLEEEKAEILEKIRDLDGRHDDGEISDDVWNRKRKHLKAEAVEIMQEIEALEEE